MPHTVKINARSDAINRLAAEADLTDVAEWLDLRVVGRGTRSPKTLCPFHEDQRPSMQLYPASSGGKAQFHCFSCGAHGDVFDLIKRLRNVEFREALEWLADRYRVVIPSGATGARGERISPRARGLELGLTIYRRQTPQETDALRQWAAERKIEFKFLQTAEIFTAFPPKLAKNRYTAERENIDALDAAGLLMRETRTRRGEVSTLPLENAPRDFYITPRVIFTIRDDRGAISGFAGRAIGSELPKYLFSAGFPRASTLYRFHKVLAARPTRGSKKGSIVHLFVVEGLMDALRLEALGLHAVALLGSQISGSRRRWNVASRGLDQVSLLTDYAKVLDRDNQRLAVHLLLDADEAGRRGAVDAAVKLLEAAIEAPGMLLDVLTPSPSISAAHECGHDPDELFRDIKDSTAALALLSSWCDSPMKVLLAAAFEVPPGELDSTWDRLPDGQRLQAYRDVERRLDRTSWIEILDRVAVFDRHLGAPSIEQSSWQEPLRRFLRGSRVNKDTFATPLIEVPRDDYNRLIRAVQIAEASTQRREFPVDEGSWERLQAAIDVTIPQFSALLNVANDSVRLDADLMLSVLVPKGDGKYRLKALPSPEVLCLQQYVLNELLRGYVDRPRFSQFIPGVRFLANSGGRGLSTTALDGLAPVGGETVSFAYTLDMDVIEHRAPPRAGMFLPFFQCWRNFIAFIDSRVAAFPKGMYHVARLDVRRFYDTVTRSAINAVLLPGVKTALAELAFNSTTGDALDCARLFRPDVKQPEERARALVDWLCEQSFDYQFEQPGSLPQQHPGGIPQGPDLSAYLANISLFPLDRVLSEVVAKLDLQASEEFGKSVREGETSSVRGAVYARYVDDMIIVARSRHDLARLRSAIEQQLALVGMELSPKTDPVPVMDGAGVREWLTDRRGVGLGVSCPSEGPPANAPLSLLEPLAGAGETDRSDSLRILGDPRLTDPETSADELETAVEVILAAPNLRHGDRAGAARHLWRSVILHNHDTPQSAADVAVAFVASWKQCIPQQQQTEVSVADLLAWLDGVERFLICRPDRNPAFSESAHQRLLHLRKIMASLVQMGLCEEIIKQVPSAANPSEFDHMLELKQLVIYRAATLVSASQPPRKIKIQADESRVKTRLIISLAEAQSSFELLNQAGLRAHDTRLGIGILFHEAVARLRIVNGSKQTGNVTADPLDPVKQSLTLWRQGGEVSLPLEKVLLLWMPDEPKSDDLKSVELALSTLINLAPRRAVAMMEKRPALKTFALYPSGSSVRLLPTPPGLGVPGLLGLRDDDLVAVRADFPLEGNSHFSPELSWKQNLGAVNAQWMRFEAPLGAHSYLPPELGSVSSPSATRWLARAFRSLVGSPSHQSQTLTCPPTASNILGPTIGADTAESEWEVLGYCVPAARVSAQAFLRQGDGGLVLEPVLELNDHLWRIGTALADWLGRAPSTRQLSSQRLAAPALLSIEGEDWGREKMLDFSLCRLRGKSLPARPLRLSADTGLPLTVERVLERLEHFPTDSVESTAFTSIGHLLATLSAGRAIQARIETRIDPAMPGGGTALLAEMVRGQFRSDEELAHRIPGSDSPLPSWAPQRRSVRALFALSERITLLAELDPMRGNDQTLSALASGTRLISLELQLRSQALELWSLLDVTAQNRFSELPPSLAEWNLDSLALLHREQPEALKGSPIPDDWRNVRELFHQLKQATSEGQRVDWNSLASITPLGWLVVLGALAGSLAGDWRGGLVNAEGFDEEAMARLRDLAAHLARIGVEGDDLPWGGLEELIAVWDHARFREAMITLNRIDEAAGILVTTNEGSRFYLESSRRGPTEVETSDGRRQISGWSISWAKALGEKGSGTERIASSPDEKRVIFRWSETWRGDQLLGIGVVQPAMASLAGNAFTKKEASGNVTPPPSLQLDPVSMPESEELAIEPALDLATEPIAEDVLPDLATSAFVPAKTDSSPVSDPPVISEKGLCDAMTELERLQTDSWASRREKPGSHVRVALFQWDVDETYRHPGFDLCDRAAPPFDRKNPELWNVNNFGISCAELRRRAMLKAALKACGRFEVEILLLPEYSTRPETVAWLSREAPTLAPKTSVWAGTYRLPPGMLLPIDRRDWSAVHEVVLSPAGERIYRLKKYPAVAAGEVFYPGSKDMDPITEEKLGDVRSYIYELICSEVFLVTFPGNLLQLARLRRELLRKFGSSVGGKDLEDSLDHIMGDIKKFALSTSIGEKLGIRRTILLVPSMTSRCQDYSVLGQAAFLASGLTTVFCNAVCDDYGHGQSCFIGHDGWRNSKELVGIPTTTPYHGAQPGIFKLGHESGCLAKKEQALVIADIDPIYGPGGQPRPQTLPTPLKLVAHLPVIETWQPKQEATQLECRCGRTQPLPLKAGLFAQSLLDALQRGTENDWATTMQDSAPNNLGAALKTLAECASLPHGNKESSGGWLMKRRKAYLEHHIADPNPWPPPVALDWLWVDPTLIDGQACPEIEAPAYAAPPGGELRTVA